MTSAFYDSEHLEVIPYLCYAKTIKGYFQVIYNLVHINKRI